METSLTRAMWNVLEDPGEVYIIVEGAGSVHTCVEECGRMWKHMEDHGMWESSLKSSMVVLDLHVHSRTF